MSQLPSNLCVTLSLYDNRQIKMDYSLCKVLSYNMQDILTALVMYDIMCQYRVHLKECVEKSKEISIPSFLKLQTGIGLFHIHSHQDTCLPQYSPTSVKSEKRHKRVECWNGQNDQTLF